MATNKVEILIEALKKSDDLKAVAAEIGAIVQAVNRASAETQQQTKEMAAGFRQVTGSISSIKRLITGLIAAAGFAAVTYQIKKLAESALQTAAGFERMKISLDTITKGEGEAWFRALNEWALKMPVNTERAIQTFIMLRAMGLQPTIEDMTTLVDATSALGGGQDTLTGIARALGQMYTKGKATAEEMRQLAEQGIPAYEILQEKLGLTAAQVADIGEHAVDGRKAVRALLEGMAERFGGQSQKIQNTWDGLMESLRSYWKEFTRQVMESGPFQFLEERLRAFVAFLDQAFKSGRFQEWAGEAAQTFVVVATKLTDIGRTGFKVLTHLASGLVNLFQGVELIIQGAIKVGASFFARIQNMPAAMKAALSAVVPGFKELMMFAEAVDFRGIASEAGGAMAETGRKIMDVERWFEKARDAADDLAGVIKKELAGAAEGAQTALRVSLIDQALRAEFQFTQKLKGEYRERIQAAKNAAEMQLADVKKNLDKEAKLLEELQERAAKIRLGAAQAAQRTESMIRDVREEGMDEEERWYSRRKAAEEAISNARRAYLEGDLDLAKEYAQEAQSIAKSLATEVKDAEGEIRIDRMAGIGVAKRMITEAGDVLKQAWKDQQDAADKAVADQAAKVEPLRKKWEDLSAQVEAYKALLAKIAETPVDTTLALKNYEEVKAALEELTKPESKTITVQYQSYTPSGTPGEPSGGGEGYARGGRIPGWGGGDRIRALLEAGEFVIRKEAVRRYGAGLFEALNNLRLAIPRIPTPAVPKLTTAFATGGLVGAPFLGRLELALPGGETVTVMSTAEEARRLERVLERLRKTR